MVEDKEPVISFDSFLFPRIFRSFRMSIQPSKLVLAFAAVVTICVVGWIMDFSQTVVVRPAHTLSAPGGIPTEIRRPGGTTELDVYVMFPSELDEFIAAPDGAGRVGVFHTLQRFGSEQFHGALYAIFELDVAGFSRSIANGVHALIWAFRWHTLYSVIFFAILLASMALAGGAICRVAALQFAGAERPGLRQAAMFGRRKFVSLLVAPLVPFAAVAIIGLFFITLPGLIGSIPVAGELLASLLLPLSLVAAFIIAGGLVAAVPGTNLMFAAIAYEDSDSFDSISRSLSSVYSRPWHMGFYALVAVVYGAVCYIFVRFFAFLMLWTTYQFLQLGFLSNEKLHGIWAEPTFADLLGAMTNATTPPDTWSLWIAWLLIRVWGMVIVGMVVAFLVSFYFSANTVIYALMRNRVDGTPLDEIYIRPEETAAEPVPSEAPREETTSEPDQTPGDEDKEEGKTSG